jgi:hypothetical protein
MSPETLNITLADWKAKFLPIEIGPDLMPRPAQCVMFNVDQGNLSKFIRGNLPENVSDIATVTCRELNGFDYDQRYGHLVA